MARSPIPSYTAFTRASRSDLDLVFLLVLVAIAVNLCRMLCVDVYLLCRGQLSETIGRLLFICVRTHDGRSRAHSGRRTSRSDYGSCSLKWLLMCQGGCIEG